MQDDEKKFYSDIPASFKDPLVGGQPRGEVAFSSALAALHQEGAMLWKMVPMFRLRTPQSPSGFADTLIHKGDLVLPEYPLPADTETEIRRWGGKRIDLSFRPVHQAKGEERIVFVEAKLNSTFTGDRRGADSQIGQYLTFLQQRCGAFKTVALLVLTPRWNGDWYRQELIDNIATGLPLADNVFWTSWESIFESIAV